MKNSTEFCMILVTTNSFDSAKQISKVLVQKKLAACCSIFPGITSIYNWNDKINEDLELMILIKTRRSLFDLIEREILEHHSYDVPEIIMFSIDDGYDKYMDWLSNSTIGSVEKS